MTKVALIDVRPRLSATGAETILRFAGGGRRKGYHHEGEHWSSGLASRIAFAAALGYDRDGPTGGSVPATARLVIARPDLTGQGGLYWRDASITIRMGDEETGVFGAALTGTVAEESYAQGRLILTINDLGMALHKPVLADARFAGTGGAEGGSEAEGRPKRRSWGRCAGVAGHVLDKANNIYEFGDPGFRLNSFEAVRDAGIDCAFTSTIAWQGSVAATLAALAASSPADGEGVAAPSIACIKWWTQPRLLTADLKGETGGGYVETAAAIAERIVQAAGGPAISNVAAMVTARPAPAGLHIGDNDETTAQALNRLLLGSSLLWKLNPAGTIDLRQWSFAAPVASLRSIDVERVQTLPPVYRRRVGYKRNHRPHGELEIATSLLYLTDALVAQIEAATDAIAELGIDGWLTGTDKKKWMTDDARLEGIFQTLRAEAVKLKATDEVDAADDARDTYHAYRDGLAPAWNATGVSTAVVPGTYRGVIQAWGQAIETLRAVVASASGSSAPSGFVDPNFDRTLGEATDGWGRPAAGTGFSINATAGKDGGPALVCDATGTGGAVGQRKVHAQAARAGDRIVANFRVKMQAAFNATGNQFRLTIRELDKNRDLLQHNEIATVTSIDAKIARNSYVDIEVPVTLGHASTRFFDGVIILDGTPTAGQAMVDYFDARGIPEQADNAAAASMPAIPNQTIRRSSSGAILAGELTRTVYATRKKGSTVVTSTGTTWSVSATSGITVSIGASTGVVSITAATSEGTVTVTSARTGEPTLTQSFRVEFADDPAPATTGGTGATYGYVAIRGTSSSNAFAQYGSEIVVKASPGGTIDWLYSILATGTGSAAPRGKVMYRPVSAGSFTDATGSDTTGYAPNPDEPGSGSLDDSGTITGVTAGADYRLRFMGARVGTGPVNFSAGGFQASSS